VIGAAKFRAAAQDIVADARVRRRSRVAARLIEVIAARYLLTIFLELVSGLVVLLLRSRW
jgi:hypothetical protein